MEYMSKSITELHEMLKNGEVTMDRNDIFKTVDHTLLTQTATWAEIKQILDDGIAYGTASSEAGMTQSLFVHPDLSSTTFRWTFIEFVAPTTVI